MFGWNFEVHARSRFWRWNLIKIYVWTCDMNSTLGSVVPLAMFSLYPFFKGNASQASQEWTFQKDQQQEDLPLKRQGGTNDGAVMTDAAWQELNSSCNERATGFQKPTEAAGQRGQQTTNRFWLEREELKRGWSWESQLPAVLSPHTSRDEMPFHIQQRCLTSLSMQRVWC